MYIIYSLKCTYQKKKKISIKEKFKNFKLILALQ